MNDVDNHILLISTVTAFVKVSTVLLIMNFSNVFGNKLLSPSEYLSFCRKFCFIFCFSRPILVSSGNKSCSVFVSVCSP